MAVLFFGGSLLYFAMILFLIPFIKPLDQLNKWLFFIIYVISILSTFIFNRIVFLITSELFFIIPLTINQFFTAYFAFKICMDSSTNVDDYLYKNEKSRLFTRIIEFFVFLLLNLWISLIYVQVSKIVPKVVAEEWQILQAGGLFVIFVFFNLLFGIHSIIAHKQKK